MVLRLNSLRGWNLLKSGEVLELPGVSRRLRLELNVPQAMRVDLVEDGKEVFVAVVEGYQVLDLAVYGPCFLTFTDAVAEGGGEVWYRSDDGVDSSLKRAAAVSYTKLALRKERNVELDRILYKAEENARRREARLLAELERVSGQVANLTTEARVAAAKTASADPAPVGADNKPTAADGEKPNSGGTGDGGKSAAKTEGKKPDAKK